METSSNTGKSKGRVTPEDRVRDFQRKLYRKAKQEPKFRFYSLYDKVCRSDFLSEAYRRVRLNRGSPGIDGTSFDDIEDFGLADFLTRIQQDLRDGSYRPDAVKRVVIPKANGPEVRCALLGPLGIPTIRDRVAQMSCKNGDRTCL